MKIRWDYIWLAGLLVFLFLYVHGCEDSNYGESATIKNEVKQEQAKRDSVKTVTVYKDSVRTKTITKYRTLKDTVFIPVECEPVVKLITSACDSAIHTDSSLIYTLKETIKIDSSIITKQSDVIVMQQKEFKKKLRRQKARTIITAVAAGIVTGILLTKE